MTALRFEIQATCPETGARAGLLHTAHGTIETPVFMPVGTQGTVKGLAPRDLINDLDAKIILANTYHLFLRPGHERIGRMGGLHKFMSWPRAILTDSGGFQIFSLDTLRKVSEEGVLFRSHLNGDAHMFTPESTVDVQLALGSDIMMVLDECLAYPATHEVASESMARTVRWARKATRTTRGGKKECTARSSRSCRAPCTPICAGRALESLLELDAAGYAIGGLSVGEPRNVSLEMTAVTAPLLPKDRPRYVMGVGMPEELPQYVAHGIDMMDCVLPSRNARNGYLFTSQGKVVIKHAKYLEDETALDPVCPCYTCCNFSKAYLRHLFQASEILFSSLATLHNIQYFLDIMRQIRQAILLSHFPDWLRHFQAQMVAEQKA